MISVESLGYRAGQFSLSEISFEVADGETLVLLGPTGAGKTVLLELIAGVRRCQTGRILVGGQEVTDLPPERRRIGLVYQDYLLFPHLNVSDNIAYGLRAQRIGSPQVQASVTRVASRLGIGHLLQRRIRNLSGGEQQRVALARTLVTEPRALLLDEPFSALDPGTKEKLVRETVEMLSSLDIPVILVTHDQVEAAEVADRIAVMNVGKIVQLDTPERVFAAPKSEFVARFVGVSNVFRGHARKTDRGTVVQVGEAQLHSSLEAEGWVHVTIRPEDIIVSRERLVSSARNSIQGKIVSVVEKGPIIYVTADCGFSLTAAVTREGYKELKSTVGDLVFMTFKASNLNLF